MFFVACGGVLTRESGEISSPNYPGFYPPNSDCIWVIKPPSGKPVEISFKSFNIEAESRCGYDFVEVPINKSFIEIYHIYFHISYFIYFRRVTLQQ